MAARRLAGAVWGLFLSNLPDLCIRMCGNSPLFVLLASEEGDEDDRHLGFPPKAFAGELVIETVLVLSARVSGAIGDSLPRFNGSNGLRQNVPYS